MTQKKLLFAITTLLFATVAAAQPKEDNRSLHTDSASLVQWQMTQSFNQQKIDSLVKLRLEAELKNIEKNSDRSREVEAELARMKSADSIRKAQQLEKLTHLKETSPGYPVAPFNDTLFNVYLKLGPTFPDDRAAQITARIERIYEDNFFKADSLVLTQNEIGYEIDYKNNETIMIISQLDALWFNKESSELAVEYRDKIAKAVLAEKAQNSFMNWSKRIGLVILIVIGAALLVYLINKLFGFVLRFLRKNQAKYFKGITIGKFRLFSPEYQEVFFLNVIKILRIAAIIIALYLCLPLLFYVFPDTQDITNTMLDWIISPAKNILSGIVDFLPNFFTIVVIYIFTSYIVKTVKYFSLEIEHGRLSLPGFYKEFARPTFNIVRFILYAFMLVIVFPYLPGSDSPAFQGVSVFLGLLISLGSSSAINNMIAGIVITYMRPFRIGDRVKIGETVGDVVEKSMLVIKILTTKNEEITVPNSTILSSNTINYSAHAQTMGLIVHTTVTIGYDVPWRKMHETLISAALRTTMIKKEPAPFVLQTSLDDFYVSYQINAYSDEPNKLAGIYSALHQNIQDCCNEAGIEIMSPHYANLRDGNNSTIPADYLQKDYAAPPFNVHQTGAGVK